MHLIVRRANVRDAAAYARIMGDPQVLGGLLQMPYTDEDSWRARLTESTAPGKTDLLLVAELGEKVVGNAGLHPASPALRRRHAMHMGIAVAPDAQRRGVGSALMAAICAYADGWAQVLRIELNVYTDNAAAIALYEKFGFRREGISRAYAMRDGVYVDVLQMARLHPAQPLLPAG